MGEELAGCGDPERIGSILLAGDQRCRHGVEIPRRAGLEEGGPAGCAPVQRIEEDVPALVEEGLGIGAHLVVDDAAFSPLPDLLHEVRDEHGLARSGGSRDDRVPGLGSLRRGDAGDGVGPGSGASAKQQQAPPPRQGAPGELSPADQLSATQAAAPPEPSPQEVQPEEAGDGEARADAAAEHCSIDGPVHHTGTLAEVGLERGDLFEAADVLRVVRTKDRPVPVGIELQGEHDLGYDLDAHDVAVVLGGLLVGFVDCGAQTCGGHDHCDLHAETEPRAEAPGCDPEPAAGVAAGAGHREASAPAAAAGAPVASLPAWTAAGAGRNGQLPEPCEPALCRGLGRHGPDGAAQRREGEAAAAHPEVAPLCGVGHAVDEAQHLGPLLAGLRIDTRRLPHGPVDGLAVGPGARRRPGRCRVFSLPVAEPGCARRHEQRMER